MMNKHNNNENNPSLKAWDYQQRDLYDQTCKDQQVRSQFQETLIQTLNRIELKLDILLMQKQK